MFALVATLMVSQYCSDLGPGERVLCNQMYNANKQIEEIGGKLDRLSEGQAEAIRKLDVHDLRITNNEERGRVMQIDLGTIRAWRDELMGKITIVVALLALGVPLLTSWLNRTWAKRDKARGHG